MADRAIVIGIGRYPNLASGDLAGPVQDAREVADWLTNTAKADVTLVTSDGSGATSWQVEERPTRDDIEPRLIDYTRHGRGRLEQRLYIYMAGHGFAPDANKLALITANAVDGVWLPNIEGTAWALWFAEQLYFDEIVLWMDCCATRIFEYESGRPLTKQAAARQNGMAKIFSAFAARAPKAAYEGPVGPGQRPMGLFTSQLLRGLNGAAANAAGVVDTESLIRYFQNTQPTVPPGPAGAAAQRLEPTFPWRDNMIFVTGATRPDYDIKVPVKDGVEVDIRDGNLQPVGRYTVAGGMIRARLHVGLFKASAPGFQKHFEVAAGTDGHVDLR